MRVITDAGSYEIGTVEVTPTIGITDYSRRVTDDFGVTTVVKRGFARRMSVRMAVPFEQADAVQRRLADLRATSARWVADDRFAWLSAEGFYKDFELDLAVPPISYCTLTVEGLAEAEATADVGGDPAPDGAPSTLQLLRPIDITPQQLVASSVDEDDAPAWASGVTYSDGAIVSYAHQRWESLTGGNVGNEPLANSPTWLLLGPTNRWAMFDSALGTATTAAGQIVVTLNVAGANALALLDVKASTVRVQTAGYNRLQQAGSGTITFLDLPAGAGPVTVSIGGAGQVSVGTLLAGDLVGLGITEASPKAGITDFSRKVVDDFGEVTIVQRAWAKRMSARALIRTDALDAVANRIAGVRARPSLWIGQAGLDTLTIYGFFKDFGIEVGESVSKLSLSIEGLSTAAKPVPLGAGVNWPDIADPDGTKPSNNADKTSENTSKDTNAVGGKPAGEVIAKLDRIEPIEAKFEPIETDISALADAKVGHDRALDALGGALLDQGAVQRRMDREVGELNEGLLRALMESARTRDVLRDAGIVVDPATGQVRIYAIDQLRDRTSTAEIEIDAVKGTIVTKASVAQVEELIAMAVLDPSQVAELGAIIARLTEAETEIDGLNAAIALKASLVELSAVSGRTSTVEQNLDALAGTVATKAESAAVDDLGLRLGSAEQTLSALPDVANYSVTIRQARGAADDAAEAALRGMLAGEQAHRYQITQIAEARQELTTKLVDGFSAEAAARTVLSLQIGEVNAAMLAESRASITRDGVLTQRLDAQGAVLDGQAAAIGEVRQVALDALGGVASAQMTIRQQIGAADQSDEALLRALLAGEQSNQTRAAQLVQIQNEFTTTLVANEAASSAFRQTLLVRMNAAEGAIISSAKVAADANKVVADRLAALEVAFNDAATGLLATRARIIAVEKASADRDKAITEQLNLLDASLIDPTTGTKVTGGTIAADRKIAADANGATATEVQQLRTAINDPETGLPKAFSRIDQERDTRVAENSATANALNSVSARVDSVDDSLDAIAADIVQLAKARVDGDSANAELIQQVRARLNDIGGVSIEQKFEALVEATGRILGTVTTAIDTNGNLVGTQLIGSPDGRGTLNLINADLRLGTGRVIFNNGTFMRVQGTGFGVNGDLISWFGPTMAVASCSRANAISYEAVDGDAYFGGSLAAGNLRNAVTGTLLDANATAQLGPFRSDGGPITVVFSYSYLRTYRCAPGSGGITGNGAATIQLRDSNSSGGVIATLAATENNRGVIVDGDPSIPDRVRWSMSGSMTLTWTAGVTDFAQLFGVITARSLPTLLGEQITDSSVQQTISIIAIEK